MQLEEMSEIQANIKLWSKKVQTTKKSRPKMGNTAFAPEFPILCKLGWHAVFTISAIDFLVVCTIYFAPYQPVSPTNFDVYRIVSQSYLTHALPELCHRKE